MNEGEKLMALYANWFNIGHNNFEIVIDFGQYYAEAEKPLIHSRIVLGPAYAKALGRLLSESLRRYEEEFGEIPDATEEGPKPC